MSDKELVIKLLERVGRRNHINSLFKDLTLRISIFLLLLLCLRLLTFVFRLPGSLFTIALWLGIAGFAIYIFWRLIRKKDLSRAAVEVDRKASLCDEMNSAYWFITNPQPEQRLREWTDLQVRRAAKRTRQIDLKHLFPWSLPSSSYMAAALLFSLIGLNFTPFSALPNWVFPYLSTQPGLRLEEQSLFQQTREMLSEADKLEESGLAQRFEDIINMLRTGEITDSEALLMLQELQSILDAGNLEVMSIREGIEEIAYRLELSRQLEEAAAAMKSGDLQRAADELRKLAEQLALLPPDQLRVIMESMQKASVDGRAELQNLEQHLGQAADAIRHRDFDEIKKAFELSADDLMKVLDKVLSQQRKNEAKELLQAFQDALHQRQQNGPPKQVIGEMGKEDNAKGLQTQFSQQMHDGQDTAMEGASGENGQPAAADQSGPSPLQGDGMQTSGTPHAPLQQHGKTEALGTQLEKEILAGQYDEGVEREEDLSNRERSTLDYRSVRSDLSPAQKDLLNQDRIPLEYRHLIKDYFQAIRPREK